MRGLGSGISNTISTMMPLVLYKVAGLVRIQRLRSEGYELTRCHASPTVLERPSDLNLCMRASPAASYSPSGTSVEIIPDISDPNPLITQAALVADELRVHARWSSAARRRCPRGLRAVPSQPLRTSQPRQLMLHQWQHRREHTQRPGI